MLNAPSIAPAPEGQKGLDARASQGSNEFGVRQFAVPVTRRGWRVVQSSAEICRQAACSLAAGEGQSSQRFDRGPLGVGARFSGQNGHGCAVGVRAVRLALLAALGRAGPVDLDNPETRRCSSRGDVDSVAGGALDP